MANPNSRTSLIEYCLRALGSPVIEINLDDDQISDRVDEAIQYYQQYHSDAVVRTFVKYQVTTANHTKTISNPVAGALPSIIDNPAYHTITNLPENLLFITRVLPIGQGSSSSTDMFSVNYQMHMNDLYSMSRSTGSLINYEMTKQYMSLINMTLNGMDQGIIFSRHQNNLRIETDWAARIPVGSWIVIEGYQTIDPDNYTDVYNDLVLKKYLTALLKRQWGQNLIKFEGMQLPGGVTINGRAIYDDAVNDITAIEEMVRLTWENPVDFYVG
jgi:hypothetical protein